MTCDTAWISTDPHSKIVATEVEWRTSTAAHMRVETAAAILYHILKYSPIHNKILVQAEIQVFWDVTLYHLVNSDRRSRAA